MKLLKFQHFLVGTKFAYIWQMAKKILSYGSGPDHSCCGQARGENARQTQKFRLSRFNILFDHENLIYLYNTFTGAFANVKPEYQKTIIELIQNQNTDIDLQGFPLDLSIDLQQGGYVIPYEFDELIYLKTFNSIWRYEDPSLKLAICPTMECNFDCTYCYEPKSRRQGRMNDDVANSIIKFIGKECKERAKKLHIVWYGGEPLLEIFRIQSMMAEIIRICNRWKIKLLVEMVTNGYLLNSSAISILKQIGIQCVQITIDGPREVHNERRRLAEGNDSFDCIFDNIINALHNGVTVKIRITVDKHNISVLNNFLNILARENTIREQAYVCFGRTLDCHNLANIGDYCFSNKEFSKIKYSLVVNLQELGFKTNFNLRPIATFCSSISYNSYLIDPIGNLYKCWLDIGNSDSAVGYIEGNGDVKYHRSNLLQWLSYNPFENDDCLKCKIIPLCVGGCYYYPVKLGKKNCSEFRYNLKEYLIYLAKVWKNKIST